MSVCKTEHQAFPPPHTFGILVQIDSECNCVGYQLYFRVYFSEVHVKTANNKT